jgi:hypothetical protein
VSGPQVDWWCVHEHVASMLARAESWPMAGTPEWCSLPDDDPAKLAALLDAARHWCLRLEINTQAHLAQASHAISAAENWKDIANEIGRRREAYIPRVVAS